MRIALALKGIDYQSVGVNIRIGQQNALEYRRLNPVGLVPTLITDKGESLGQSLAIADWLDRHYPQPLLLPQADSARMRVLRSFTPSPAIFIPLITCAFYATLATS